MKSLFLIPFLILSVICYSQTEYYSTNGKNRLTKTELDNLTAEFKSKLEKSSNNDMFLRVKTKKTERVNDSIIHFVNFDIKDKSTLESPLAKLENNPLPEAVLKDINGNIVSLPPANGKPTIINFWFAACKPCVDEMPVLNKIYDKYKDDYNFIAITFESKAKATKFFETHPYKFTQVVNARSYIEKLRLKSFPVNLFIDSNGVVQFAENGIPYFQDKNGKMTIGDGQGFIDNLKSLQ